MTQSTRDYVLPDGTLVAHGWTGLTSGSLLHIINESESGGTVGKNQPAAFCGEPSNASMVWSAVNSQGNTSGGSSSCNGWTDATNSGGGAQWGRTDQTSGSWTQNCSGGLCSWSCPIYCIGQ